jgi:hypothetical protein
MDEINAPEEVNNPEKSARRLFSEEWREAWKQVEEQVRQRPGLHLIVALAIAYLLKLRDGVRPYRYANVSSL